MSNVSSPRKQSRLAARWRAALPLVMALLLIVAACGGGKEATPAPSPTAAAVATTTLAPTPTSRAAAPTPAPTPSPTPVPPTPTPAAKYGGVLNLVTGADPGHLDTHQKSDLYTRETSAPGYDGILQFDPYNKNAIIPDLAERWELSADGKTLTFFLHKGVKFHDGAPFTADDVLYNITLFRDLPGGTTYRFSADYKIIQEAVAVDETTVRLKLERNSTIFLLRLAMPDAAIYPKHVASRDPANAMKNTVLGTGPFKLKEYRRGIGLEYVKNDAYWLKGRPFLDGIQYTIVTDVAATLAALRTGRADVQCGALGTVCDPSPEIKQQIVKESGGKIRESMLEMGGINPVWLGFNPKVKPYDDPRVRTAINLALDRSAYTRPWPIGSLWFYNGPGSPFVKSPEEISKIPGYRPDKTADIAEAKRLLKEAGLESGFTMTVYGRNAPTYVGTLEIIAQQLKPLNITVKISPEAVATFVDRLVKGDYGAVINAHAVVMGDPSEDFALYVLGNQVAYDDPALKQLVAQQDAEPDQAKRKALVDQVVDKLYRDAYVVYLIHSQGGVVSGILMWNHVKNFKTAGGIFSGYKWLHVWLDR